MDDNQEERPTRMRNFTVEPAAFLIIFAWSMIGITLTNQLMYQSCVDVFGYNVTTCNELNRKNESELKRHLEEEIQPFVAKIELTTQVLLILVATTISLILGPWSDENGRKPVFICSSIGSLLNFFLNFMFALYANFYPLTPWIYVLSTIPFALAGGTPTLVTAIFSYISDVSPPEKRSLRGGIFNAVSILSILSGSLTCSYLSQHLQNAWIFALSTFLGLAGLFVIVFFTTETVSVQENRDRKLLQLRPFKQIYQTAVERRPSQEKSIVWGCLFALCCMAFTSNGPDGIFYLFTREKFNWNTQSFMNYTIFVNIFAAFGTVIGLIMFKKLFKSSDSLLGTLGFMSSVIQNVFVTFAQFGWQLYVGASIGLFRGLGYPTCRSILANITSDQDLGKINALVSAFEACFSLFAAPTYTWIYTNTITWFPAAFNLLSGFFNLIAFGLLLMVNFKQQSTPTYSTI